jgi:hypothetical protein
MYIRFARKWVYILGFTSFYTAYLGIFRGISACACIYTN